MSTQTGKEDYVSDVSDADTVQGAPRIAGKLQKLRERQRTNSLSGPPERTNTADSLTSDF